MLNLSPTLPIHLCCTPTDMRKNFDGLCGIITGSFRKDPLRDGLFVFVNKRRDRMKLLVWAKPSLPSGMGVQFTQISSSVRDFLRKVFSCRL